jgi:hypothetical protein
MLVMLVQTALTLPDGAVFDSRDTCPACGGGLSGYDTKKRRFAALIDDRGQRTIVVTVKRFRCRLCGKICNADEPFYPGTRIGAPVVDLCTVFSRATGYGRAARSLSAMGVAVNRMQCRHFAHAQAAPIRVMQIYGYPVPQSVISLSALAGRSGEGGRIKGAEVLAACGFPSAHRAALQPPLPRKERDNRDEQEDKEERKPKGP